MANPIDRCCTEPGCPDPAVLGGRCRDHRRQAAHSRARTDPTQDIYRSKRWRILRAKFLRANPWCQWPDGCNRPAQQVDHRVRIKDGGDPWDETNMQGLCRSHHSTKTARETGFGGQHG